MRRRPHETKDFRRPQGIKEIREAREKADAERKRLLERYKDHQLTVQREQQARTAVLGAKRSRFASLSVGEALAAARRLSFIDLEGEQQGNSAPLNRPTLALLELFLKMLQDRGSVSILQWPRGLRDISILHPLAMLATLGSSPGQASGGYTWCPAVPDFRTLYLSVVRIFETETGEIEGRIWRIC